MKLAFYQILTLVKNINPALAILGFALAVFLAFYPRFFSLEYGQINRENYELVKSQLGSATCKFVEDNLDRRFGDPKVFIKSIPASLPASDRYAVIDIFDYKITYAKAHSTLILIAFIAAIASISFRESQSARKYSIAHSTQFLHRTIHCLRDHWDRIFVIGDKGLEINKTAAKKCVGESLEEVEKYFSTITGAPCRACIKVPAGKISGEAGQILPENEDILVKTFARSTGTKTYAQDIKNDTIARNSDFYAIAVEQKPYYHKPNIDKGTYWNSHLADLTSGKKPSEQLHYRSTFTFGIKATVKEEKCLYGFLCIDSPITNVFKPRHDVQAGFLVSDFFGLFLRKYKAIKDIQIQQGGLDGRA